MSATLFVAFAMVIGSPKKVSIGTVKSEPPPPTVLRKAPTNPVRIIKGISMYSTEAVTPVNIVPDR
jgi:hypothetical protein